VRTRSDARSSTRTDKILDSPSGRTPPTAAATAACTRQKVVNRCGNVAPPVDSRRQRPLTLIRRRVVARGLPNMAQACRRRYQSCAGHAANAARRRTGHGAPGSLPHRAQLKRVDSRLVDRHRPGTHSPASAAQLKSCVSTHQRRAHTTYSPLSASPLVVRCAPTIDATQQRLFTVGRTAATAYAALRIGRARPEHAPPHPRSASHGAVNALEQRHPIAGPPAFEHGDRSRHAAMPSGPLVRTGLPTPDDRARPHLVERVRMIYACRATLHQSNADAAEPLQTVPTLRHACELPNATRDPYRAPPTRRAPGLGGSPGIHSRRAPFVHMRAKPRQQPHRVTL